MIFFLFTLLLAATLLICRCRKASLSVFAVSFLLSVFWANHHMTSALGLSF